MEEVYKTIYCSIPHSPTLSGDLRGPDIRVWREKGRKKKRWWMEMGEGEVSEGCIEVFLYPFPHIQAR